MRNREQPNQVIMAIFPHPGRAGDTGGNGPGSMRCTAKAIAEDADIGGRQMKGSNQTQRRSEDTQSSSGGLSSWSPRDGNNTHPEARHVLHRGPRDITARRRATLST